MLDRLAKDAAARPSIDRPIGKTEFETRAIRMVPWSTIVTVVAVGGWTLFNGVIHPSDNPISWLFLVISGFFVLVFLTLAARKAFGKPPVASRPPLNL